MKAFRIYLLLAALIIVGGLIGFYLSTGEEPVEPAVDPDESSLPEQVTADFPEPEPESAAGRDVSPEVPPGAIPGEYVIHFESREDFLAYIAALRAAGQKPLGQIDALLAVRIPEEALLAIDLDKYGARASYSHEVERPLPPVEIDPQALAGLRAYGESAQTVVGGPPHGDGSGTIVAILDSGIEAHPHFDDVRMTRLDLAGGGMAGTGAGHGTSVASVIGGKEGIAPGAELFLVRVLDAEGLGNSYDVAEGIVEATDRGAKIINLSLGVYQDSQLLRQAVDYAHDKGAVLVAAAGNEGYDGMPFPADYEKVLSVTALDAQGRQAVFPNQSEKIDFAAPGIGIRTAKGDEGTTLFSGTSAAAPFVSGTLASLMSGEKAMSAGEAVELLQRYLNDAGAPGADPVYGAGAVDWDRLRERDTPEILDVALAGIHLSPDARPGTNMPVEVTVQNRGTKWFNEARLEVLVNEAEPVSFTIGTLGPGQTTTRKVFTQVPSLDSEQALDLAARVLPEDLNEDVRLENNLKAVQFRPR
ncbi:MAG: S8 family serine peptidase [Opitutales bacterium]